VGRSDGHLARQWREVVEEAGEVTTGRGPHRLVQPLLELGLIEPPLGEVTDSVSATSFRSASDALSVLSAFGLCRRLLGG